MTCLRKSAALLTLAAVALLLVSSAVALSHDHENLAGRVCQACQVGHLPLFGPSSTVALPALFTVSWHSPLEEIASELDAPWTHGPSRAPPA